MATQLILPVRPQETLTLANFFPGENQILLRYLQTFIEKIGERYVYIWGGVGAGCSHLLQACCHAMRVQGGTATYIPLSKIAELDPQIFENLENFHLVCIDDVQVIAGKPLWEEALFHFYNRLMVGGRLLIAAKVAPLGLGLQLPDLASRLASGMIFQIQELSDDEKLTALTKRANSHGLELTDEVGQFLLRHYPRDLPSLFAALKKLDDVSLIEQRRLTIPFIKQVLEVK